MTAAEDAYALLAEELRQDPDDDVVIAEDGLRVHGNLFAYLDGIALAVRLPDARARDLETRGMARRGPDGWMLVTDRELWSELAGEAHTFVGEPPVGGES